MAPKRNQKLWNNSASFNDDDRSQDALQEALDGILQGSGRPLTNIERDAAAFQAFRPYRSQRDFRIARHNTRNPCIAARHLGIQAHVRGCQCRLDKARPTLLPRGRGFRNNRLCGSGQKCFCGAAVRLRRRTISKYVDPKTVTWVHRNLIARGVTHALAHRQTQSKITSFFTPTPPNGLPEDEEEDEDEEDEDEAEDDLTTRLAELLEATTLSLGHRRPDGDDMDDSDTDDNGGGAAPEKRPAAALAAGDLSLDQIAGAARRLRRAQSDASSGDLPWDESHLFHSNGVVSEADYEHRSDTDDTDTDATRKMFDSHRSFAEMFSR